jgi:hypothetical protein
MHTKKNLRDWFKNEYWPALEFIGICYRNRIYNIDEKGAKIACLAKEEVVVPVTVLAFHVTWSRALARHRRCGAAELGIYVRTEPCK